MLRAVKKWSEEVYIDISQQPSQLLVLNGEINVIISKDKFNLAQESSSFILRCLCMLLYAIKERLCGIEELLSIIQSVFLSFCMEL